MPTRKKHVKKRKPEVRLEHRAKVFAKDPAPPVLPVAPKPRPSPGTGKILIEQLGMHSCKWPFGDRAPYLFCGDPQVENSPYCADHTALGRVGWRARL